MYLILFVDLLRIKEVLKLKIKKLKTGVIGTGMMGQNHVRVLDEISNLVGVSDANEAQGKKISEKYDVSYFKNYKDLLLNVDAVTLAVPTKFHHKIALDCIDSGISILIEKPLASSVSEAREIVDQVLLSDITVAVGHIERFNPVITAAKKYLDSGDWGNLVSVSSKRVSSYPDRISDVGVLLDTAIHDIDAISYLVGSEVNSVYGSGKKLIHKKCEDHVNVVMNFRSGVIATIESSWLMPTRERKLSLITDKVSVNLDYISQSIVVVNKNEEFLSYDIEKVEPLKLEIKDFLNSIVNKSSPLVTSSSACKNLEIANLIQSSIDSNEVKYKNG